MKNKISLKSILKEAMSNEPLYAVRSRGVGDFYIQVDGENAGKPLKVKPEKGKYYAVITNKNILLPGYFYYLVEHLYKSKAFERVLKGTTLVHLSIEGFDEVVAPFVKPPRMI